MSLVEITYAILGGDGRRFFVTIDEDDTVITLKEEMKKRNPTEIVCEVDELELYNAFELHDGYIATEEVQRLRSTSRMLRLKNTELVRECDAFAFVEDEGDSDLADDDYDSKRVHVVVMVPLPLNPTQDCMLSMVFLKAEHYELMIHKLGLQLEFVDYEEPNNPSDEWCPPNYIHTDPNAAQDPQKIALCVAFLRKRMPLDEHRLDWLESLEHRSLLTTTDERLPFGLRGTATLLLVDRRSLIHDEPLAGVRMVVEVEAFGCCERRPQALAQLIAASLKAPQGCTPISLVTNLTDCWLFSWLDTNKTVMHVSLTHPQNALAFIKAATASSDSKTPFSVPFIDRVFTKHRLDELIALENTKERGRCCSECCQCEWMVTS
ncbi:hypothetical protein PINS_up001838 [Pythium insidiosum]|nr:hypothetical protein PINS_up001838 [Pythium insidiosum]